MSLSKHLQTSGLLDSITGLSYDVLKEKVLTLGNAWYAAHPEETTTIASNLSAFGLDASTESVAQVRYHTILHYVEKFLPLTGNIASYADFLEAGIEAGDAINRLRMSSENGRGICIAGSHFGAIEFIAPYLALHRLPMNVVLKFSTEALSQKARDRSRALEESGRFSLVNIIELGKPKTMAAMEMAATLRRNEILLSVFDEKTPYSKPVELFNTTVWGGAGLDRMITFANVPVDLYVAFMVRCDNDTYRLELHQVDTTEPGRLIPAMYQVLESVVRQYPQQWYFLHETIPLVLETNDKS